MLSNLFTLAGACLVVAAVAELAGAWPAVLLAGLGLIYLGYIGRPVQVASAPTSRGTAAPAPQVDA